MDNKITLYSLPACPKCKVLKSKLTQVNIDFKIVEEVELIKKFQKENGLSDEIPLLSIEGVPPMNFIQAIGWLSQRGEQ